MGAESEPPSDVPIMPPPGTSAAGSRGTAIEGDVDRSVLITGHHNVVRQYFVRHYPSLKDYVYDFDAEKKPAERFVGRVELFQRLDDFAKKRPSGYFRVVADAGLGKTALAAAAAKRLKAPVFFANASRGLTRPDQCLNHLAGVLIGRFGLDHDHLPARAGEDSAFLGKVLAEAADKAEGPLWIVVDALDEADPPAPGRNPLLLPDRLPQGVYILLTHRPGDISLNVAPGVADEEYRIASSDADQQADIEAYLRQEAERPEIRRAREAANPPISIDRFVQILKGKSEGNFQYLKYLLADIAEREQGFDPLDLDALPSKLRGYYQKKFWEYMERVGDREDPEEWNLFYLPVIAFLAAAREPVAETWLAALVDRRPKDIERRALKPWRRFLSQEDRGREDRRRPRRWRVVHQSFVDFLDEEDTVDLRAAHDRVASFYLSAWGGLDAGLPALFDPARREDYDDYGLRHLAEHLERAGRIDDLHRLLRLERRGGGVGAGPARTENVWYAARERVGQAEGYMNDLARAARLVWVADRPDVEPSRYKTHIGPGIRYALMSTSLNNLARNIPPTLIAALVEKRVWPVSQGLAFSRILPPKEWVDALIGISSHLDHDEKRTVLREALDVSSGIGDEWDRALALTVLAPRLAALGQVDEAQAIAGGMRLEWARAVVLAALGQMHEALQVARGIGHGWARAYALAALGQADEALAVTRGIGPEGARALALDKLAPYLVEVSRVDEALAVAREIGDERTRDFALAALAPRLAALGQVDEALELVRGIGPREPGALHERG